MKYYKKVNKFGQLIWIAELAVCNDKDAIEIPFEEYEALVSPKIFEYLAFLQ